MTAKPLTKIMYVEDEPDIREIARMALEQVGGFTVEICESGQQALSVFGEFQPDLVLLDVMLPGMDGPSILAAIREREDGKDTPVIMLTAKVQSTEVQKYKDLGALDVITKPFDPIGLSDDVRAIWRRAAG